MSNTNQICLTVYPISQDAAIELSNVSIEDCNFSVRSYHVLEKSNILNLYQLAQLSEEQLIKIKNCGKKSVSEMKNKLEDYGIKHIPIVCPNMTAKINEYINSRKESTIDNLCEIIRVLKNVDIDSADLSSRTINCLHKFNIKNLYEFAILSSEEVGKIRNLGKKSITEIANKIKSYGLPYPFKNVDCFAITKSIKILELSPDAIAILTEKKLDTLEIINALDEIQFNNLIDSLPLEDATKLSFFFSSSKKIKLNERLFLSYTSFTIKEICKPLNETDKKIINLSYGLDNGKRCTPEIMADTLAISINKVHEKMEKIFNSIIEPNNLNNLKVIFDYINTADTKISIEEGIYLLLNDLLNFKVKTT